MDKKDWITSRQLAELLGRSRDNDLRVEVNGILVPIGKAFYHHPADMWVILLDEECEDYKIAMTTDPIPEEVGTPHVHVWTQDAP